MSRIGKKPVEIPKGVTVAIAGQILKVKGPKGELAFTLHPAVRAQVHDGEETEVVLTVLNPDIKKERALWGVSRALIQNMVRGVTVGYEKKLEINGIGYRVAAQGKNLKLEVGFSHPVEFKLPEGIEALVEKNLITLRGIDKQQVGEVAAQIRRIRPPEPYKGKGIKYLDEVIRRKAGKAAKGAGAA